MAVPNSDLGGGMEGMDDMNNAPIPPMDTDIPEEIPQDDEMGGEQPPMEDQDGMEQDGEDKELLDIINNLSIEDKAAVKKYAKSMSDDEEGSDEDFGDNELENEMPMEGMRSLRNIIDETINDVFSQKERKRDNEELPQEFERGSYPFKSKNFKNKGR